MVLNESEHVEKPEDLRTGVHCMESRGNGCGRHRAAAVSCFPLPVRLPIPPPLSCFRNCREEGGCGEEFYLCERRWTLAGKRWGAERVLSLMCGCDRYNDYAFQASKRRQMQTFASLASWSHSILFPPSIFSFWRGIETIGFDGERPLALVQCIVGLSFPKDWMLCGYTLEGLAGGENVSERLLTETSRRMCENFEGCHPA